MLIITNYSAVNASMKNVTKHVIDF